MKISLFNVFSLSRCARFGLPGLVLAFSLAGVGLVQAQPVSPASVAAPAPVPQPAPAFMAAPTLSASSVVPPGGNSQAGASPYGLQSVWAQGDGVARLTVVLLALMSLMSWYLILAKVLGQRRLDTQANAAQATFAGAEPLQQRMDALPDDSPFRFMVVSAVAAVRRHESLAGQVDMNAWLGQDITRAVATLQMRSQEGLSVLATVGSTAPFVGLFGTVWGIYNALVTIGVSGQASIDKVAGPVGEALIMTALGLAVAVPAVLGYNWLVRRNRVTLHAVRGFGSELHTQLLVEIDKGRRAKAAAQKVA
jgi:biopolymer transport protein ExbB